MKVQLDAQVKAVDQLKGNTRMLENKLAEAKSKKDTLKARAKSASTSKQINEMLQGLNTSSASSAFDRMEEKVMALEGESEAAMQVFAPRPSFPHTLPSACFGSAKENLGCRQDSCVLSRIMSNRAGLTFSRLLQCCSRKICMSYALLSAASAHQC